MVILAYYMGKAFWVFFNDVQLLVRDQKTELVSKMLLSVLSCFQKVLLVNRMLFQPKYAFRIAQMGVREHILSESFREQTKSIKDQIAS